MLQFLDELKEGYAKADKALGGFLPGGGTGNPLSNTVREGALKIRDAALDKADRQLHEELFIKAHTGGASGDGVIRELPDDVLGAIKRTVREEDRANGGALKSIESYEKHAKFITANPDAANHKYEVKMAQHFLDNIDKQKEKASDKERKAYGNLDLYTSRNIGAHLGLGTVGVYFDKDGNVLIKDKWKVDGYNDGEGRMYPGKDGKKKRGLYGDLAEGGYIASDAHDLARKLGTSKDLPIEVRLTKEQWEAIKEDKPASKKSSAGYKRKYNTSAEYSKKRKYTQYTE